MLDTDRDAEDVPLVTTELPLETVEADELVVSAVELDIDDTGGIDEPEIVLKLEEILTVEAVPILVETTTLDVELGTVVIELPIELEPLARELELGSKLELWSDVKLCDRVELLPTTERVELTVLDEPLLLEDGGGEVPGDDVSAVEALLEGNSDDVTELVWVPTHRLEAVVLEVVDPLVEMDSDFDTLAV